jgi:hypothetical protein
MLTGAFSASGARNTGHEAIAEASPGRKDCPLLGQRQGWMPHHVLGMLEDGAGVQERLKVEDVVVVSGRRPHVFLHSKTSETAARHIGPGCRRDVRSGRLGFELVQVVRRRAVDGDAPRLHGPGISRTSSILSRLLSMDAFFTWT